ncbi:MFS transporter [Pseudonocardia nematodicida]|uniref:MFS transporter n=1 Tax=Pseudonocardia nematodicida TaxID=1206997 RepID=A0ABV1KGL9_9PSEU
MTSSIQDDAALGRSAFRKAAFRIVPFVGLMFFINYLDRTAIGLAGPNGMNDDLALTAAQFGFASGIFFLGYILLEVPSNLGLQKFGARKWLARIMVSWGVVSVLFTWVQNYEQLWILRFVLGVAEAGFVPGAVLFLTMWFPRQYRMKALAGFYLAQPITMVLGAPLGGLLIQYGDGLFGLAGWRFMFFAVGMPAVIVGFICYFYLTDSPSQARWLTEAERNWFVRELAADTGDRARASGGHLSLRAVFRAPKVFAIAIAYFGLNYGVYSLAFFLPSIIAGFQEQFGTEFSIVERGLITAIPYVPAAFALYFWSRYSARVGFRQWHVAAPLLVAGLSIPVALYMPGPATTIAVVVLTACGVTMTFSLFWSLPTTFLTGVAAAGGFALINSIANLGGFTAPYVTGAVADATGDYRLGMILTGLTLVMSSVIVFCLRLPAAADDERPPTEPVAPLSGPTPEPRDPDTHERTT